MLHPVYWEMSTDIPKAFSTFEMSVTLASWRGVTSQRAWIFSNAAVIASNFAVM